MNKEKENMINDEIIAYEEEEDYEEGEDEEELIPAEEASSVNIPISGSPVYPRIYVGESAKPLSGQFHESEYVDDNISRTWTGMLSSFYG